MDIFSENYLFFLPIACLLSLLLVPFTLKLSSIVGAIDMPDGVRKINKTPIPRLGGLAFFLSFLVFLPLFSQNIYATAVASGGALLAAAGVIDDKKGLSAGAKLIFQLAAALVATALIPPPENLSLFALSMPISPVTGRIFAVFLIVLLTNAANICDGLDGLCASLSTLALFSLSLFSLSHGGIIAPPALLLSFATLGFLPYNLNPAKIFMGDCGSQTLGFSIAVFSLGTLGAEQFPIECLFLFALPILDTLLSFVRRIAKGKSPFSADRGHFHHLCLDKGLSQVSALWLLLSVAIAICFVFFALN